MTIDETIKALEDMQTTIALNEQYFDYYNDLNSAIRHLRYTKSYRKGYKRFKRKFLCLRRDMWLEKIEREN